MSKRQYLCAAYVAALLLLGVYFTSFLEMTTSNLTTASLSSTSHQVELDPVFPSFCTEPIRFLSREEARKHPVALASFPGSGNTWLRFLLEQGTRIHTGSAYEDLAFNTTFAGEGSMSFSTLCVKTHFPCPKCWTVQACPSCAGGVPVRSDQTGPVSNADANVYILRSPFDAFLAEFYRFRTNDHAGKLEPHEFVNIPARRASETKYDKPTWNQFVAFRLDAYLESIEYYLGPDPARTIIAEEDDGSILTRDKRRRRTKLVFYENLKRNPEKELTNIFGFFKSLYEEEGKNEVLALGAEEYARCSLLHNAQQAFQFKRAKANVFNPWTPSQIARVCDLLGERYWFKHVWGECRSGLLQVQRQDGE